MRKSSRTRSGRPSQLRWFVTALLVLCCARDMLAGEALRSASPSHGYVTLATYRGRAVRLKGPVGVEAPVPLMMTERWQFPLKERMAYRDQLERSRFLSAARDAIVEHWLDRCHVKVDLGGFEEAKRRQLSRFVGMESFAAEDVRRLQWPGGLENLPVLGVVDLLRAYLKDPEHAETAYKEHFSASITREDWVRCKKLYGTPAALRKYAAEEYARHVNLLASEAARITVREAALAAALVAANVLSSTDEFDSWIQAESQHLRVLRADVLALFTKAKASLPLNISRGLAGPFPGSARDMPPQRLSGSQQVQGAAEGHPAGSVGGRADSPTPANGGDLTSSRSRPSRKAFMEALARSRARDPLWRPPGDDVELAFDPKRHSHTSGDASPGQARDEQHVPAHEGLRSTPGESRTTEGSRSGSPAQRPSDRTSEGLRPTQDVSGQQGTPRQSAPFRPPAPSQGPVTLLTVTLALAGVLLGLALGLVLSARVRKLRMPQGV